MQYRFSLYHTIATLGAILTLVMAIFLGGGGGFISLPGILFTMGLTFFLLLGNFKGDFLRFIPDSIRTLFMTPSAPVPQYAEIAKYGARYVVGSGALGTIIGVVQMLMGMTDPATIGQGIAVGLLTIFYALLASELFFAFQYRVYLGPHSPAAPLSLASTGIAVVITVVIVIVVAIAVIGFWSI
ncbi:MAG: MotA/TolQ/ExbB proton channel family protein [Lentisphaerota bacterium]